MFNKWENYWEMALEDEKLDRNHIVNLRQKSWREFQVFMASYDDSVFMIDLAYQINEILLFPITLCSIVECFSSKQLLEEYCDREFDLEDWEPIALEDKEDKCNDIVFYIRSIEDRKVTL